MRAAVLTAHGEPPTYAEHPDPIPGDGEVLVRITAAPVVPLDLLCASGTSYFGPPALPYVPGVQGVGVTEAGDRVWVASSAGMTSGDGTLGELCVAVPDDVVPISGAASDADVAAIGLSGVAAWSAVNLRAKLAAGESVVVLGAGGAVGQVAVAVAAQQGAGRIVGVCRGEAGAARARRNGADDVVLLPDDRDPATLAARLNQALDGTADVVIDPVFGWVAEAATRAMTPFGRLVNIGGSADDAATLSSAVIRGKTLSVLGYTNNALSPAQRQEALTAVVALAADGRSVVEHVVRPLAEIGAAWADFARGAAPVRQVMTP
jgi:NADPH:quinone reductase-like Zn-dependent oxidoreductase